LRYDKREKLRYTVNAKKTYTVGVLNFKVKGASEVEREFKEVPSVLNIKIKGAHDMDNKFKEVQ